MRKNPLTAKPRDCVFLLAGELGIEPRFRGPEPRALPLDYSPARSENLRHWSSYVNLFNKNSQSVKAELLTGNLMDSFRLFQQSNDLLLSAVCSILKWLMKKEKPIMKKYWLVTLTILAVFSCLYAANLVLAEDDD